MRASLENAASATWRHEQLSATLLTIGPSAQAVPHQSRSTIASVAGASGTRSTSVSMQDAITATQPGCARLAKPETLPSARSSPGAQGSVAAVGRMYMMKKCRITNPHTMRGQIGYGVLDENESKWLERFPKKRRKEEGGGCPQ